MFILDKNIYISSNLRGCLHCMFLTRIMFIFQPNVSGTGDNANSASSHKTPAKRSSPKHSALETAGMEIQFSSTRAAKLIKKEKI
jgi:hypothetical protein